MLTLELDPLSFSCEIAELAHKADELLDRPVHGHASVTQAAALTSLLDSSPMLV